MVSTRASGDYYSIELRQLDDQPKQPEQGIQQFEVVVTTLRAGCWTPTAADDKSTLPGRPPFLMHRRGLWWADGPAAEHRTAHVSAELVATRLFVMVPLEGRFEAGEQIVRRFEAFVL